MSTKRRQSTSGGVRKKPGPGQNPKFKYELVRYSQQGDLTSLSEEELAEFKSANAGFVAKWLTDAGAEDATWEAQCKHVLDTVMARPAAPRLQEPSHHRPHRPPPFLWQKFKSAAWFLKPVDPVALQLADYFKVVKEPMDLGTVRTRLLGGFYTGAEEMADAVHLTFSNAMMYNPAGSIPHEDAKKCMAMFEKKWEPVARKARPPVATPTPGHAATSRGPPRSLHPLRARPLPPHLRTSAPPHLRTPAPPHPRTFAPAPRRISPQETPQVAAYVARPPPSLTPPPPHPPPPPPPPLPLSPLPPWSPLPPTPPSLSPQPPPSRSPPCADCGWPASRRRGGGSRSRGLRAAAAAARRAAARRAARHEQPLLVTQVWSALTLTPPLTTEQA
jgi:hypothetical protein